MQKVVYAFFLPFLIYFFPVAVLAASEDVIVNEVMYDYPGSDSDHEWAELYNQGNDPVTIIGGSTSDAWRINDGSNHTLEVTPTQGSLIIPAKGFLIVAQNPATFVADYPSFSGNLVGSSAISLGNTSGTVSLRIGSSGNLWGQLSYPENSGAAGDGNTLQRQEDGSLIAAAPTQGSQNADTPAPSPSPSPSPTQQPSPLPSPSPTKAPSPTPSASKSPTPTPKLLSPTPKPSPQNSPQVLGLTEENNSPFPSPAPIGESGQSTLKIAGILTGIGSLLVALSVGFYLWYSKVFNKLKNNQENPNESPTDGS